MWLSTGSNVLPDSLRPKEDLDVNKKVFRLARMWAVSLALPYFILSLSCGPVLVEATSTM